MKVSILISTYNGKKDIRLLLDSIQALEVGSLELEVILRDDSSRDNTENIVKAEYLWVHIIQDNAGNVGFVASNNIAFKHATGDIICGVNQDTILHPRFILEAVEILKLDSKVVGINTNMIMPWVMSLEQFNRTEVADIPAHEYQLTRYGFVRYVAVAGVQRTTNFMTGGGFLVRRSALFPDNGLFDPEIDMYCEDTALSLRIQEKGGSITYSPKSIIYHNQAPRNASGISELLKLIKVTGNRFTLFAKINSPLAFLMKFPLLLVGVVKKTAYLGLPSEKKMIAYAASGGVVLLFFCLLPHWLITSLKSKQAHTDRRNGVEER